LLKGPDTPDFCAAGIKITDPVKTWVFKTAQNDSLAVATIYEHLAKLKIRKVAILTVSDSFGSSGREQLKLNAAKYGIQIISNDTYGPKDTDMTPQLTKIRNSERRRSYVGNESRTCHNCQKCQTVGC
jgi:branched-chain amino acid transport system substrate-binding protein